MGRNPSDFLFKLIVLELFFGKNHRLYPLLRLLPNEQKKDEATRKNCRNVSIVANFINSIFRGPYIWHRIHAFLRFGFFVLDYLSILSDFLSWEKLTQKLRESKAEQFAKLQFLNDKIDQNTNFAKLPSAKWLFLVYRIVASSNARY